MALFLPKDFRGPAWGACEQFLRKFREESRQVYKATVREGKSGFIVAYWGNEVELLPTHYLHRLKFGGTALLSLANFVKFEDPDFVQDPKQYNLLKAMMRVIEITRRDINPRFGLVFWTHPKHESGFIPDEYYLAMVGEAGVIK